MGLGLPSLKMTGRSEKVGWVDAGALGAQSHDLLQLGHDVAWPPDRGRPDVLGLAVADAVHPHIGKLAVIVVAQHLGLLVQVLDDLGVQFVQLGAVGVEVTGLGLIGGAADGGVQISPCRGPAGGW